MASFAVLWRDAEGTAFAGALVFEGDRLVLDGASRRGVRGELELPYADIRSVTVGRAASDRIDGRSSVVIEPRDGRRLLLTSATGAGMNHDIAETLAQALGRGSRR